MAGIRLGRNRFSELHDQWIDGFGGVHPFSLLTFPDLLFPLVSVEHPEVAHGGRRQLSRLAASASQGEKESRSLWGRLYPCWFLFLFAADVGSFQGSAQRSPAPGTFQTPSGLKTLLLCSHNSLHMNLLGSCCTHLY